MNTEQVARRLVELCREGKYEEAVDYLKRALRADREDLQVRADYVRMRSRLSNRGNDLAWRTKDWLKQFGGQ